jgi:hypothetical protein
MQIRDLQFFTHFTFATPWSRTFANFFEFGFVSAAALHAHAQLPSPLFQLSPHAAVTVVA